MSSAIDDLRVWFADLHYTDPFMHDKLTMNQMLVGNPDQTLIGRFHNILRKINDEQKADMDMLRTQHKKRTELLVKVNKILVDMESRPPQNTSMVEILFILHSILDDLKD